MQDHLPCTIVHSIDHACERHGCCPNLLGSVIESEECLHSSLKFQAEAIPDRQQISCDTPMILHLSWNEEGRFGDGLFMRNVECSRLGGEREDASVGIGGIGLDDQCCPLGWIDKV